MNVNDNMQLSTNEDINAFAELLRMLLCVL